MKLPGIYLAAAAGIHTLAGGALIVSHALSESAANPQFDTILTESVALLIQLLSIP